MYRIFILTILSILVKIIDFDPDQTKSAYIMNQWMVGTAHPTIQPSCIPAKQQRDLRLSGSAWFRLMINLPQPLF